MKEFHISKMIGLHAQSKRSLAMLDEARYIACIGAGAGLFRLDQDQDQEKFYYEPPGFTGDRSPVASLRSSPELRPVGNGASSPTRLIRINKSYCLDVSQSRELLVVGESGGYKPRILLYALDGRVLDILHDQHEFGVQFLKFSPSGRYLVSSGTPNDGFLYIWLVKDDGLELKHSGRCISDIRDLAWLNDTQFVTVGKRHLKMWFLSDDGNVFSGRGMLLDTLFDQAIECVIPFDDETFLVGTAKGTVYLMPDQQLLVPELAQPVKSICLSKNTLYVSTGSQILGYDVATRAEVFNTKCGSQALLTLNDTVFYIETVKNYTRVRPLDAAQTPQPCPEHSKLLQKAGIQLRSTKDSVLCWSNDEARLVRWPSSVVDSKLRDITVADECGPASLLVGSLSGDISLAGNVISAHDGPVSDVHASSSKLCVSCSRDRTVQIWGRENPEDAWALKQTLVLPTPILRVRMCFKEGQVALICSGLNKTIFSYTTSEEDIPYAENDSHSVFPNPPRTLFVKGTPYDMIECEGRVILSTNDKLISILDPFATDMLAATWRPRDSNKELVNLTHLTCFGGNLLIGTGSNKCILAFDWNTGDLVACLWGFGETLSGIAALGPQIIGASDVILVSELKDALPNKSSSDLSSPGPKLPFDVERSPRKTVRRVYATRSRSTSPVRARSPIRAPQQMSPPRVPRQSVVSPDALEKPPPLRLSGPLKLATPKSVPLNAALKSFLESSQPVEEKDKAELKRLLIEALNKIDALALFEHLSSRLEATRLEAGKLEAEEAKLEPSKLEAGTLEAKLEPSKLAAKLESKLEAKNSEPSKPEPSKPEPSKPEPSKLES